MKTPSRRPFLAGLLAAGLLLGALRAAPARAEPAPARAPAAVLAEGWSPSKLFSGVSSRTRVIQVCVVAMCIALFIMIKKLGPSGPDR